MKVLNHDMEDQAAYTAPDLVDLRELVAPVAAWLASLGFQVICGPLADGKSADLAAHWRSASGSVFEFWLMAQAGWACCQCGERVGTHTFGCFSWTDVREQAQVQWLLEQNRQFRQARAAASRAVALPAAASASVALVPDTTPPPDGV